MAGTYVQLREKNNDLVWFNASRIISIREEGRATAIVVEAQPGAVQPTPTYRVEARVEDVLAKLADSTIDLTTISRA